VFLHAVGFVGHVGHFGACGHETSMHSFSCSGGTSMDCTGDVPEHVTQNMFFASSGIRGSRNAFQGIQGMKRRHNISDALLGPIWI
jgi:hypothetical protein